MADEIGPADASDITSMEQANAEIARLSAMLRSTATFSLENAFWEDVAEIRKDYPGNRCIK